MLSFIHYATLKLFANYYIHPLLNQLFFVAIEFQPKELWVVDVVAASLASHLRLIVSVGHQYSLSSFRNILNHPKKSAHLLLLNPRDPAQSSILLSTLRHRTPPNPESLQHTPNSTSSTLLFAHRMRRVVLLRPPS